MKEKILAILQKRFGIYMRLSRDAEAKGLMTAAAMWDDMARGISRAMDDVRWEA